MESYIASIIVRLNTSKEQWWNDTDRENPKYWDKNQYDLSTTDYTFDSHGFERPANNRLSLNTDFVKME